MTEKERIRKDIAHRLSVAETMLDASPNNEMWYLVYSELKNILSFIDESENKNWNEDD